MRVVSHIKEDAAAWWRRFWNQPNRAYRNFQLAFFLLGAHFLIPSLSYAFNPKGAIAQLAFLGSLAGAGPYKFAEDGFVWRILGAGNVFTLAFMCFMVQANVKRFYAVLAPLVVMKAFASIGFLCAYLFSYRYPVYLGIGLWDGSNVLMFLYFAHTAWWSLEEWGEDNAVPRLFFKR